MKKGPVLGTGIASLILLLVAFGVTYMFVSRSSPGGSDNLKEKVEEERKLRGEAVSRSVAEAAVDPLLEPGIESDLLLGEAVTKAVKSSKDLLYVLIRDAKGKMVADAETNDIPVDFPPEGLESLGSADVLAQLVTSKSGVAFYNVAVPVQVGRSKIGEVHSGILAPKIEEASSGGNFLPKFLMMGAVGVVGILIVTVMGVRSLKKAVPPEVTEYVGRIPELREEEEGLTQKIAQKREEVFSLTKDLEDKRKDLDQRRKEEGEISKRIDSKKKEEAALPQQAKQLQGQVVGLKQEVSKAAEELNAMNQRVRAMREEEQKLQKRIEAASSAAAAASSSKMKTASPSKIEAKKREELELIQRIVGKRREEIAISQRIEAKRKEGIDLVRQIEALKKQLESLETKRGG